MTALRAAGAVLAVAAGLAAAGCPSRPASGPGGAAAAPARGVPSTPLPSAVPLAIEGPYVHPGSGIEFPVSAEGFQRIAPRRYDAEGNDVGIGYRRAWRDFRAEVTIYAYPAIVRADGSAVSAEEQFSMECDQVREGKEALKLIGVAPAAGTLGGTDVSGRAAEFEFGGGAPFAGRRVRSVLTVFARGDWRLKYRVTLPADRRDAGLAGVRDLLAAMKLPPLGVEIPADAAAPPR